MSRWGRFSSGKSSLAPENREATLGCGLEVPEHLQEMVLSSGVPWPASPVLTGSDFFRLVQKTFRAAAATSLKHDPSSPSPDEGLDVGFAALRLVSEVEH